MTIGIVDQAVVMTHQYWPHLLLDCVRVKIWQLECGTIVTIVISLLLTNIIQEAADTQLVIFSSEIHRV